MTGKARLGYRPSKKSIKRMVEKVHALTDRAHSCREVTCGRPGRKVMISNRGSAGA